MKKKILGGKDKTCSMCGSMMIYIKVKGIGTISQCKACGSIIQGRAKDEVKIYSYEGQI